MRIISKLNNITLLTITFIAIGALFSQTISAQTLNLDNGFTAGVSDSPPNVYISTAQPDGKILVGGNFQFINGVRKPFLVRLNTDGTLDGSFNVGNTGPSSYVYEIIVLPDGKILIGGAFGSYNGVAKGGLAKLNSDGSLDTAFNSGGTGSSGTVQDAVLQTDGKILISGNFTAYNGVSKFSVARVNADGTLDNTFTTPLTTNQFVEEVAIQSTGKILIAGVFSINTTFPYTNIARLNTDGSLDTTFQPGGTDDGVYALSLQADGKILIGGAFNTYTNIFRPAVARLNADGMLDSTFNPGNLSGSSAEFFAVQPDGKILVAGGFTDIFNQKFSVLRFNSNGSIDNTFQPPPTDDTGYSVKLQADGKVIVTGFFTTVNNVGRRGIMRLDANGNLDSSFNASFSNLGLVDEIVQQPDGKVIVAGTFQKANGTARFTVARFNMDGTLDTSFNAGTGSGPSYNFFNIIHDIELQPDGKILIGGIFGSFNGVQRPSIVRLNSDGSVDQSFNVTFFNPTQFGYVYDIFVQSDGKILLGGVFADPFSSNINGFFRLNTDGSLDTGFTQFGSSSQTTVYKIRQQPDGKFLIGGAFTFYKGTPRSRIARVNPDGSLDTSFNPGSGTNGTVLDIGIQADGKIIIAGAFTSYNGISRNRLARLNTDGSLDTTFDVGTGANSAIQTILLQPNGKILIGGFFSAYNGISINRLARINSDGSLDTSFVSGFANDPAFAVRDITRQSDGKILIGGVFDSYNGVARNNLLRLSESVSQRTRFDFDGDGKSDISVFRPSNGAWYINQSTAGFTGVTFGFGSDIPTPADFDGDGKTDVAVFRPSAGGWYRLNSSDGTFTGLQWGLSTDVPIPADFDGDGKADVNVFRPSDGGWYRLNSSTGAFVGLNFGQNGDKPLIANFDGDGKSDIAVFRPSTASFYSLDSSTGNFRGVAFGFGTDIPTMGDFDGDGKTDVAVFRPSNGAWYRLNSSTGAFFGTLFGLNGDIPVAADYDGDGKADIAVFRNGNWYYLNSSNGAFVGQLFGFGSDKPIPSAFQ